MRAALRHLCEKGVEALRPQKVLSQAAKNGTNYREAEVWRRPVISKRVANDLRKQALRAGTYGTFDTTSGVGWDPMWDLTLFANRYKVTRFGGMQPKKKTSRERTREDRAVKLEANLENRLELMEEYYTNKDAVKVKDDSFEARFKDMARGSGK